MIIIELLKVVWGQEHPLVPDDLAVFAHIGSDDNSRPTLKISKRADRIRSDQTICLNIKTRDLSKDRLCNPKATVRLFDKIPAIDKHLVLLRNQGHLTVETSQIEPVALREIASWIQGQSRMLVARRSGVRVGATNTTNFFRTNQKVVL